MTNVVGPLGGYAATAQAQAQEQVATQSSGPKTVPQNESPKTDSVTLSAAAQTNAALVKSAQEADGVDHNTVASIKAALANGSYNVSPDDLAQAISTVLEETRR